MFWLQYVELVLDEIYAPFEFAQAYNNPVNMDNEC
jgi:hypothetical protein